MGVANYLDKIVTAFGRNNKPTYVVMAIAVAKGIFRPLYTMCDKTENPETKKYTAIREGLTEVIAIPSYFVCGELASKLASRFCGEHLGKGWKKLSIGDEVVALKLMKDSETITPCGNKEISFTYPDGQQYKLTSINQKTKLNDNQRLVKLGKKLFLLDKPNTSKEIVKETSTNTFSIDNIIVGFKRLKDNPALLNAKKNLMFMGVCTAALFVIPALCSVALKPMMGYIQKPPKNNPKQTPLAYTPTFRYDMKAFGTFKANNGFRIGGV